MSMAQCKFSVSSILPAISSTVCTFLPLLLKYIGIGMGHHAHLAAMNYLQGRIGTELAFILPVFARQTAVWSAQS